MKHIAMMTALALVLASGAAQARETTGTVQGEKHSGTYERSVNRDNGTMTSNTNVTGSRGTDMSREVSRSYNTDTDTLTRETNVNGNQRMTTNSRNADGSWSHEGTVNRRNGTTADVSGTYSRNADGSISRTDRNDRNMGVTATVDGEVRNRSLVTADRFR